MKKTLAWGLIAAVLFALPVLTLLAPKTAEASGTYMCTVAIDNVIPSNTLSPSSGTCNWAPGSDISVQCTTNVYYRVRNANVAATPSAALPPVASANDIQLSWTLNADPFVIQMNGDEQIIGLLAATVPGSCKFYRERVNNGRFPARR